MFEYTCTKSEPQLIYVKKNLALLILWNMFKSCGILFKNVYPAESKD